MSKEVFDNYQLCNCCGKKFLLSCEVADFTEKEYDLTKIKEINDEC